MHKETVTYEDFDGVTRTEDVFFNITKTNLLGRLSLIDRFEEMMSVLQGPKRELTTPEKQEMLDLIKDLMELSYGIRSLDGRKHDKTEEIWAEFRSTALYDHFLYSLFVEEGKADSFMMAVMPPELIKAAREEAGDPAQLSLIPSEPESDERKIEDYTKQELLDLSDDEFEKLAGTDTKKWSTQTMQVAYERKVRN